MTVEISQESYNRMIQAHAEQLRLKDDVIQKQKQTISKLEKENAELSDWWKDRDHEVDLWVAKFEDLKTKLKKANARIQQDAHTKQERPGLNNENNEYMIHF